MAVTSLRLWQKISSPLDLSNFDSLLNKTFPIKETEWLQWPPTLLTKIRIEICKFSKSGGSSSRANFPLPSRSYFAKACRNTLVHRSYPRKPPKTPWVNVPSIKLPIMGLGDKWCNNWISYLLDGYARIQTIILLFRNSDFIVRKASLFPCMWDIGLLHVIHYLHKVVEVKTARILHSCKIGRTSNCWLVVCLAKAFRGATVAHLRLSLQADWFRSWRVFVGAVRSCYICHSMLPFCMLQDLQFFNTYPLSPIEL